MSCALAIAKSTVLLLAAAALMAPWPAAASPRAQNKPAPQSAKPSARKPAPQPRATQTLSPADQLARLVRAAESARASANPVEVARANSKLIAAALRQMGQLRILEGAFAQAVSLFQTSLDFDDLPDARVDLAIAFLRAGQPDQAVAESAKVLLREPNNARAFNVQGKSWMKKKEFARAAEALQSSLQIQPDFEAAYSLGICLLQSKQKERAAAVFQRIAQLEGESGSLYVLFGRAYRDADLMDDAIRELKRAVALDPRAPHAHYFLGLAYLMRNEWAATPAVTHEFQTELRANPRDFLSNYFLGVLSSTARDYAASDRYLRMAQQIDPTWPETWLYLGLNAHAQGDLQTAEQQLRKAVELTGADEARSNFQIRKAYITLGRILSASGRSAEAGQFQQKARILQQKSLAVSQQKVASLAAETGMGMSAAIVPLEPEREEEKAGPTVQPSGDPTGQVPDALLALANLTEKEKAAATAQENQLRAILGTSYNDLATSEALEKQFTLALGHYQEAERWDPAIPGLLRNLGAAAFRQENYIEAARALRIALDANPADNGARAMLGMSLFGTDAFAEAVRVIEPLGEAAMRDPALGYAWAASLVRLGKSEEATRVLGSVEKGSASPETLVLLGQLWLSLKDYPRAIAGFQRASAQNPAFPKAHYYAGIAFIRNDRPVEAEAEFKQELNIDPDDLDAKYNLGFVYQQQSKIAEAAGLFREVIAAKPDHADAQYQLGKILLDQDDAREAIGHLEKAARLNPGADYIHYQLQSAYRKDSRTEDADRELQLYKNLKAKNRQTTLPLSGETP